MEKRGDYIYAELKLKVDFTLQLAEAIVDRRIELSEGKNYNAILNGTNVLKIESDAGDFMDTSKASLLLNKVAVITPNLLNIVMFNSWMYLKKRDVPIKLFKSLPEAESWLRAN